ncbi:phosphatase IMPL1, chloroplastic-like isoform X1 [Mangifera indica]|uniref:phosphatase IMPL1, chloroplastic-like isoform X1 n=1 Tax=Mangifera indica TaxID=29780 RepID=UPI001CF9AD31|nr:phosphatase IMPL1, chloroplastic-like isoform X1 [Mangifera indica]
MGRSLISFSNIPLKFSYIPRSFPPLNHSNQCLFLKPSNNFSSVYKKVSTLSTKLGRKVSTTAVLSETSYQKDYPKIGAKSTGPIPPSQLIQVVETAAKTGSEVVMDAVNRPRNITYKGLTDLVTDTDKNSEAAILEVVKKNFGEHLILGEEGGIIGDTTSDYLWCIDPLEAVIIYHFFASTDVLQQFLTLGVMARVNQMDGTTNFAHGYPSFAVSVGVLFQGNPAAAAVVEFVGGPMCWNTRLFSATAGGGSFCNGQKIYVSQTDQVERSLLVTGFGYEHDDAWATNIELFKEFTDVSRGVRRLGAAAVDMCHVALGIVESYWEYRLKPWDMAAGVLIVEEAGGAVTRMDGGKFCVFDRSVLVSNGVLHARV